METTETRCQRCGYLPAKCGCPEGVLLPPPPGLLDGLPDLLFPGEVAKLFRVDPKTVTKWATQGKLNSFRTLGGHRRYRKADVEASLNGQDGTP